MMIDWPGEFGTIFGIRALTARNCFAYMEARLLTVKLGARELHLKFRGDVCNFTPSLFYSS